MAASLSGVFSLQEFTDLGAPLVGGRVYTYTQGTTTFKTAYTDKAGTIPHTYTSDGIGGQYIALNARGELPAPLYLTSGSYDIALKDSTGATIWTRRADPVDDSSSSAVSAYAADLADTSASAKGSGLQGFNWSLYYASNTIGWGARTAAGHTNILRYIPPSEWAALQAGTSTYDILSIFNTAKASNDSLFFPAGMHFYTSGPLVMDKEGFEIIGGSRNTTIIDQLAGFSGVATVNVNGARLQVIQNMHVRGGIANSSDAIRVTDGQMLAITDVMVKVGVAGVRLISGNSQRWTNVYAESNTNGFMVVPDAGDNTNGCTMLGLRAYGNTGWGLDVQAGAGPNGHMHSTWDVSTEANGTGARVRAGRYCRYTLYSESNTGVEFDLDPNAAHEYFLKNPDGSTDGALANTASLAIGVNGKGANLYVDHGIAPERYKEVVFAASGSLAEIGVTMWDVTNTSGATKNMTLTFLSTMPVGFRAVITKRDNTAGLTPVAPGGITLTGDTGTFGAFVASVKRLEVIKINATTAILIQSGS